MRFVALDVALILGVKVLHSLLAPYYEKRLAKLKNVYSGT